MTGQINGEAFAAGAIFSTNSPHNVKPAPRLTIARIIAICQFFCNFSENFWKFVLGGLGVELYGSKKVRLNYQERENET